jgi:ABC-2 type transport system permease protein
MLKNLKFLGLALITNIKITVSLKASFFLTILIVILKQLLFLVTWNFFFEKYKVVHGWNFNSMLFMYGNVCFAMGIVEGFFYGFRDLARMIETGQIDNFLLQPKNIILNIAVSKGDITNLGEILTGLLLIGYSGYLFKSFFTVILILIMGSIFMFSLILYLACIAFFIRDAGDFIRELRLNSIIMATQPLSAFRGALKMLSFTVLPVAFLSYFPVEHLRTGLWHYLLLTIIGTILFFAVACALFYKGIRRYESGNMFAVRH